MNVIIGQAHFIKTVEDLHEALAGVSRICGSAWRSARPRPRGSRAGHSFVILLREGLPVNVLNPLKAVPEVCTIFCATANPVDVLVAVTNRGRGIIGVIDGSPPIGIEQDTDVADRRSLLRAIGYKL